MTPAGRESNPGHLSGGERFHYRDNRAPLPVLIVIMQY